jgi:hypothetical protein
MIGELWNKINDSQKAVWNSDIPCMSTSFMSPFLLVNLFSSLISLWWSGLSGKSS